MSQAMYARVLQKWEKRPSLWQWLKKKLWRYLGKRNGQPWRSWSQENLDSVLSPSTQDLGHVVSSKRSHAKKWTARLKTLRAKQTGERTTSKGATARRRRRLHSTTETAGIEIDGVRLRMPRKDI